MSTATALVDLAVRQTRQYTAGVPSVAPLADPENLPLLAPIPAALPKPTLEQRAASDAALTLSRVLAHNVKLSESALDLLRAWAVCAYPKPAGAAYPSARTAPAVLAVGEAVQGELRRRRERAAVVAKPALKPMVLGKKKGGR
jgi:hypothetical protein